MRILAFETSCDDTAVAIVEDGWKVISAVRLSQVEHEEWGGVVPEIAARMHAENWDRALHACLEKANLEISDVDAIACTQGPGLQNSLLIGTTAAGMMSLAYDKPLIGTHHIHGHICSVFLDRENLMKNLREFFPSLVLTVSGGHTQMHLWTDPMHLELLGQSRDDACGEAFDKVAKMLGLGYPGGPVVSRYAEKGDRNAFDLPRIYLEKDSLDFSFSGLKAAVFRILENPLDPPSTPLKLSGEDSYHEVFIADVCASFEMAVGRIFEKKIERALEKFPEIKNVCFVGGVSANKYLRNLLTDNLEKMGKRFLVPAQIEYSTDNAAMIGAAAFWQYQKNPTEFSVGMVDASPRMRFE